MVMELGGSPSNTELLGYLPRPPQVALCGPSGVSHLIIMGKVKVTLGEKTR